MIIETAWGEAIELSGDRAEFAEYVRCLRALPDDDQDKATADQLADRMQHECVDREDDITIEGHEFDAMSAALEKADHADAQRFIAAIAEAEAEEDDDDE